jgi:hypothetical protein
MSIQEILGENFSRAAVLEVNTLESMIFVWHNGKFEGKALPPEAQLAPAFGLCVGDLDGDGAEDLFLSQNFFAVAGYEPRCDAGRGLWLKGNGRGELSPVPGQQSGVEVYGEQRGCALGDYDKDGRVDLVVTQNGAETKLFRNVAGRPGLRVRLLGPPGNPHAVGAAMRLQMAERLGPLREIHAGSGYWSQDSCVMVLASADEPTGIWVRWPGGKIITAAIPRAAREITLDSTGKLEVLR